MKERGRQVLEMDHSFKKNSRLGGYDNVLVVNQQAETLYYDVADLTILMKLGHRPEDFLGQNILSFYTNLEAENSTIMQVLKSGQEITNVEQHLITHTGSTYLSKSSTYPIRENGLTVGAVEFSTHYFNREDIELVEGFAKHPLYRKNGTQYTIRDVIATSQKMKELVAKLPRIAKGDSNVLLYGKTGTGKNVIAQCIHNLSDRFAMPFLSLDCGTLTKDQADQVLFGTEGGNGGLFEKAQGGTVFLDEVNVLHSEMQAKLLKVIEEKRVRRIGGTTDNRLDVRIVSATNIEPDKLMYDNQLREDFYYRLSIVRLDLPELIQRTDDIEPFIKQFIHFYNSRMNMNIKTVAPSVLNRLVNYSWPGNIRELRNAIEAAFYYVEGDIIEAEDFPQHLMKAVGHIEPPVIPTITGNLRDTMEEMERALIEEEFIKANGSLAETARKLGISKQSLKYKLDKYRLRL